MLRVSPLGVEPGRSKVEDKGKVGARVLDSRAASRAVRRVVSLELRASVTWALSGSKRAEMVAAVMLCPGNGELSRRTWGWREGRAWVRVRRPATTRARVLHNIPNDGVAIVEAAACRLVGSYIRRDVAVSNEWFRYVSSCAWSQQRQYQNLVSKGAEGRDYESKRSVSGAVNKNIIRS